MRFDLRERCFDSTNDLDAVKLWKYVQSCKCRCSEDRILDRTTAANSDDTVTLVVGSKSMCRPVSRILECFWNDEVSGRCAICDRDFDLANPPIRTISLQQKIPWTIRVHNRHLMCIMENTVPFIPISHVWHKAIAIANCSFDSTTEAAQCLKAIVCELLSQVTTRFSGKLGGSNEVEIWHDYVSVPQWKREVQSSLLSILPSLYGIAPFCIIHLEDTKYHQILSAARLSANENESDSGHNYSHIWSNSSIRERYDELRAFFAAIWFRRMWVTLEYAYCKQACICTAEYEILWNNSSDDFDSFSVLFNGLIQRLHACYEAMETQPLRKVIQSPRIPILGPLADMRQNVQSKADHKLCFAEALTFVAQRECTCQWDRYLAAAGFLKIGDHGNNIRDMPKDIADACLWLAQRCLERGDYSPLLVLQGREPLHPKARWLSGHSDLSRYTWDLGPVKTFPPPSTIQDNKLILQLNHIGTVEKGSTVNFKNNDGIKTFDTVLSKIIAQMKQSSVHQILCTLDRIYAIPEFLQHLRSREFESFGTRYQYDGFFRSRSTALIDEVKHCAGPCPERLRIADELSQLLLLQSPLAGTAQVWTGLQYAGESLADNNEYDDCLVTVRCPACHETFIYRIFLLKTAKKPLELYRIPGLKFSSSLRNGVGLVVNWKRIVGRITYGTPACDCLVKQQVEVW